MTNVNIYEGSLMINVDLSHKVGCSFSNHSIQGFFLQVLNKTTVYQRLQDIFSQYQDARHAQDTATKELVGQVK